MIAFRVGAGPHSAPHQLKATWSPGEEAIAVALRRLQLRLRLRLRLRLLPLADLRVVVRAFINPAVSRSGQDRCLCRPGVTNLRDLQGQPVHEPLHQQKA